MSEEDILQSGGRSFVCFDKNDTFDSFAFPLFSYNFVIEPFYKLHFFKDSLLPLEFRTFFTFFETTEGYIS